MDILKPTHMLAMGYRLWGNMPSLEDENLTFKFEESSYPYGFYSRDWGRVAVMVIKHPSTAFAAPQWHRVINQFLAVTEPRTAVPKLARSERVL